MHMWLDIKALLELMRRTDSGSWRFHGSDVLLRSFFNLQGSLISRVTNVTYYVYSDKRSSSFGPNIILVTRRALVTGDFSLSWA